MHLWNQNLVLKQCSRDTWLCKATQLFTFWMRIAKRTNQKLDVNWLGSDGKIFSVEVVSKCYGTQLGSIRTTHAFYICFESFLYTATFQFLWQRISVQFLENFGYSLFDQIFEFKSTAAIFWLRNIANYNKTKSLLIWGKRLIYICMLVHKLITHAKNSHCGWLTGSCWTASFFCLMNKMYCVIKQITLYFIHLRESSHVI